MDPITGLAYGRIAVGTLSLLSPKLAARLFLLDPATNPQVPYMSPGCSAPARSPSVRSRWPPPGERASGWPSSGSPSTVRTLVTGMAAASTGAVRRRPGILLAVVAGAAVATGVLEPHRTDAPASGSVRGEGRT